MSRGALQKLQRRSRYEKRTKVIFCTTSKKGLENRSSRFEPGFSLISISRGSGPPLRNLVISRSKVRFRPKTCQRQLRFTWIWANRPSSKGSKLLFPIIKAIQIKKPEKINTGHTLQEPSLAVHREWHWAISHWQLLTYSNHSGKRLTGLAKVLQTILLHKASISPIKMGKVCSVDVTCRFQWRIGCGRQVSKLLSAQSWCAACESKGKVGEWISS